MSSYPLAKNGVFRTIQGEGALLGVPMVFVRLGGCSIGCQQCDTDYRVHERLTAEEIVERVLPLIGDGDVTWVWVTGGEPADHPLTDLLWSFQHRYCKTALATSGSKDLRGADKWLDFLSVSPHGKPGDLSVLPGSVHRYVETQINLVPGLNGLQLSDWVLSGLSDWKHRWVTPMDSAHVPECMAFVQENPGWRLGIQAHKTWGVA